eukprot:FR740147.1.p1 GENE.FR740147.1~~FR740147.1.p1  ORF type:complete len:207 (+),score=11.05 FR740147.1:35-622(+)
MKTEEMQQEAQGNRRPGVTDKPIRACCHICGQSAGTQSLKHHIEKCTKRFLAEERHRPPQQRRAVPSEPRSPVPRIAGKELDRYNESARAIYQAESTFECPSPKCGRKFDQESQLLKHMKMCCSEVLCEAHSRYRCHHKICKLAAAKMAAKLQRQQGRVVVLQTRQERGTWPKGKTGQDATSYLALYMSSKLLAI